MLDRCSGIRQETNKDLSQMKGFAFSCAASQSQLSQILLLYYLTSAKVQAGDQELQSRLLLNKVND